MADKEVLRLRFRSLRRESQPTAAAGILAVCLRELPLWLPPGRRLGLYWPIGAEPDLRPLADHWPGLRPGGLALPAVEAAPPPGPQLRMVYRPWRCGDPLAPDACRIPAPLPTEERPPLSPRDLALLLVPALAIDRRGVRLGSGGGWYDRLRCEPAWRGVRAFAVLPARCVSATPLPRDPWDVPFDGWIDETGLQVVSAAAENIAGS